MSPKANLDFLENMTILDNPDGSQLIYLLISLLI